MIYLVKLIKILIIKNNLENKDQNFYKIINYNFLKFLIL